MASIIVGSQAARHYYPEFPREPRDVDTWSDYSSSNFIDDEGIKHENKDVSEYPNLLDFLYEAVSLRDEYLDPTLQLTLKISHIFWNVHFEKNIRDIIFFQQKGLKANAYYVQAMKKDWEIIHGKKKGSLNKCNEDFFRDNVKRTYVHDSIHQAVAYGEYPWYSKLKKDPTKALLSKEMFDNLEHYEKIQLCREEIYTTCLERFLIPSNFETPVLPAYRNTIKKLLVSMTRNWFPLFIVENMLELKDLDNHDFIEKFNTGLRNGIIKSAKEKELV